MLKRKRYTTIALLIGAAAWNVGCQSYQPDPPDLAAHHAAWFDRSADDERVAAYADALAASHRIDSAKVFDPADGVSVHEAEVIALVFNPDLRLARSQAGIAQATRDFAGQWDDPTLGADVSRLLRGADHPWEASAIIRITLPVSGRLEAERKRADAAHDATLLDVLEAEWDVRTAVRRAWIDWSAAREKAQIARSFLEQLDDVVGIVEHLEDAGELARVQAALFYIEQHQRRNEARSFAQDQRDRALALRHLLGLPPGAPGATDTFVPALAVNKSVDGGLASTDDAAEVIRQRHPAVRALRAAYETAERALAVEIRRQYPDLVIGPGYGYEGTHHQVIFGVSLPLPIWNRNQQGIAEAEAERAHTMAQLETTYERLLAAHAAAESRRDAAREQLERMQRDIIPLVDEQFANARRIAELGEVDTLLLLDTLRRQYEAKLSLVDLTASLARAEIELAALRGPPQRGDAVGDHASGPSVADKEPQTP